MFRFTSNESYKNLNMFFSFFFTFFFPLNAGRNECSKHSHSGHSAGWYILSGKQHDKSYPSPKTDDSLWCSNS